MQAPAGNTRVVHSPLIRFELASQWGVMAVTELLAKAIKNLPG